jgi:hypothetical protein
VIADYDEAPGWPAEATPVRVCPLTLLGFQPRGTPFANRPLWWRALTKRGSLR